MEQPPKQRTGLQARGSSQLFAWIISSALLVAALGLLGYRLLQPLQPPPKPAPEPPARAPEPQKDLAPVFEEAQLFIRQMKWTEAREKLVEVQATAPSYPGLTDALKQVEKEIVNSQHFEGYREALGERKMARALSELEQISADTAMFETVLIYRRELQESIGKRILEARAQLERQEFTEAQAVLEDVLAAAPDASEARELLELAIRRTPYRTPPLPPAKRVSGLFIDGKLPGAIALAAKCAPREPECKDLLDNLKLFQRLFQESSKEPTFENLSTLITVENRITGPKNPSKVFAKARPPMAKALYEGAKRTQQGRQWVQAVEFAMHAKLAEPKDLLVGILPAQLHFQGIHLYRETLALEKGNRGHCSANLGDCTSRLREVMDLTNPKTVEHQLAKTWLEQLETTPRSK